MPSAVTIASGRDKQQHVYRYGAARRAGAAVALPPTAIGKDLSGRLITLFGATPQPGPASKPRCSVCVGVKAGWVEGIEVNVADAGRRPRSASSGDQAAWPGPDRPVRFFRKRVGAVA